VFLDVLTFCLGVQPNVFSQIFLPLKGFLFWHYIPNNGHASLPQFLAESLRRIIKISEVNLWNDLGAKFDDERDLFPQVPQ
jgi:hypothetical protein